MEFPLTMFAVFICLVIVFLREIVDEHKHTHTQVRAGKISRHNKEGILNVFKRYSSLR